VKETTTNQRFIYEFGRFVLDPQEKTFAADGKPIHLPAKEFETLLLLVENNGRALSKEEMLQAIWQDTFVEENNLAKYVSRLRKIFDADGRQYIETLPKHGYRFSADVSQKLQPLDETILEKRTIKRLIVRVEEDRPGSSRVLPQAISKSSVRTMVAVLGLVAVAGALGVWYWRTTSTSARINSIAVLPLKALSGEESNKALGLGLTDALISKLGTLQTVTVRPTSAVVKFAGTDVDALEIGKRLMTDAVLEGTIQQAEGRIRVNARLLRTKNGEQLWAETFDQPANDIFALQDALSNRIAKTIAFELKKSDLEQIASRPTQNNEAYEKYLRGRFYQSQNTSEGLYRSIELYQEAIALDPKFANAYAGIADANVILFNFGLSSPDKTIPAARQALSHALELDPNLSNAHTAEALIQLVIDHNWPAAERSLQQAIELDPNNADAFLRYGYFLTNLGRFDEALAKLARARELNPLAPIVQTDIGLTYLCARRYPEAIEQLERVAAENPAFPFPLWLLQAAYLGNGNAEKAFASGLRALEAEGGGELVARLKQTKETNGLEAANRLWLTESVKAALGGRLSALTVAQRAAIIKDREQTLSWLEKSVAEHDPTLSGIKYSAQFDFVRDDQRFQALVNKLPT
jgi:TolB-like protein/DNA-binding winged helix-turn-helix (wHTH) protein/Tfp pilus assembly protein PilF